MEEPDEHEDIDLLAEFFEGLIWVNHDAYFVIDDETHDKQNSNHDDLCYLVNGSDYDPSWVILNDLIVDNLASICPLVEPEVWNEEASVNHRDEK